MKKAYIVLPLVCSIAVLQGCQTLSQVMGLGVKFDTSETAEMRVEPAYSVHHSDMSPEGLYKLGQQFQSQNQLEQAADAYRSLLVKDADHIEARNALASIYAKQNKFDEAIAELQAVLKQDPKFARAHNNLGYVYFLKNDYSAAISELGTAIALDTF